MSSVISIKNADEGIFSGGGIGVPAYRAGNGIYIKDYNISAKYDNESIKINDDSTLGVKYNDKTIKVEDGISVKYDPNTLRVSDKGLTADPYTAGSALKIIDRQVSVQADNDSIKVNKDNQLYVDKDVVGDKYWIEEDIEKHLLPAQWYLNMNVIDKQGYITECKYDGEISDEKLAKFPKEPSNIAEFTIKQDGMPDISFTISCHYDGAKEKYVFKVPDLTPKVQYSTFRESGIALLDYSYCDDLAIQTYYTDDRWSDVLDLYYPDKMVVVDNLTSIESVLVPTTTDSHVCSNELTVKEDITTKTLTADSSITIADKQIKHIDGYSYEFREQDLEERDLGNGYYKLCFKSITPPSEGANVIGLIFSYSDLGTLNIGYEMNNNKWICPEITVREGTFKVYYDYSDDCGFSVSSNFTHPLQMYLRGELFIRVLLEPDVLNINSTVSCKSIVADNVIPLYRSPIPYLYKIVDIGQTSIDEPYQIEYETETQYFHHDLWYIDFGYHEDSEEFAALIDGQPFEFTDGAFGNHYSLVKRDGKWQGDNYKVYGPSSEEDEHGYSSGNSQYALRFEFPRDDISWRVLQTICHFQDEQYTDPWFYLLMGCCSISISTGYSGEKEEPASIQGNFVVSGYGHVVRDGTSYEYVEFKNKQYVDRLEEDYYNYLVKRSETDSEVWNYYTNNLDSISATISISLPENQYISHTVKNICHQFDLLMEDYIGVKDKPNYMRISSWDWNISKHLDVIENQGLRLYMDISAFWKINDNDYEYGTNPFAFVVKEYDYSVVPQPESCTRFECPYNFYVNGIVIGDNIETHAFALNNVGNNVEVMMNQIRAIIQEIQAIEQYLLALAQEIAALNSMFDFMMIMDAAFSLGEGLITGITMAAKAIMKCGEKTALKGIEGGMELGEDMAKTDIRSAETSVQKLTATGEIDAQAGMTVSRDFKRLDSKGDWVYKTSLNEETGTFVIDFRAGERIEYHPLDSEGGIQNYWATYSSLNPETGEYETTVESIFRDEMTNEHKIKQLWGVNPTTGQVDYEIAMENQRIMELSENATDGTQSVSMLDSAIVAERDTTGNVSTTFKDGSGNTVAVVNQDGITAERIHMRLDEEDEAVYEIYVDEQGRFVQKVSNNRTSMTAVNVYSKNGDTYQMERTYYEENGTVIKKDTYDIETKEKMYYLILNETGIDINTGKISESILDGEVKITVDEGATAIDLKNCSITLRDENENVLAQIGTNAENRLEISDAEGTIAEVKKDPLDKKVKLVLKRIMKAEQYFQAATVIIKAIKASIEEEELSQTGIDIDYDDTEQNPDNDSKMTITAGEVEIKTLNSDKGITLFGHTYKGFVDPNDQNTWTSEYICDGSAFASILSRLN